jgi:phosphoglycerate dehydrogenase-like enzyme
LSGKPPGAALATLSILIASRIIGTPEFDRIVAAVPNDRVEIAHAITADETAAAIETHPEADVLLGDSLPSRLSEASRLRWIQTTSAGVDHLRDTPLWRRSSVSITTASGLAAIAMAQYAMAYVLRFAHNLGPYESAGRVPEWRGRGEIRRPFVLFGRTLGIIGYGGVGRRLAHAASAFGLRVIALRNSTGPLAERFRMPFVEQLDGQFDPAEFWPRSRLHELLREVDFLVVAAPLTKDTEGLIGAAELALMKPSSYLINVSRGKLVDEAALANALRERRLAGAALDVYAAEPPPPTNPLLSVDSAATTPHISGHYDQVAEFTTTLFLANLARFRAGQQLLNIVDRERGY